MHGVRGLECQQYTHIPVSAENGQITNVWVGKLPSETQTEVVAALFC